MGTLIYKFKQTKSLRSSPEGLPKQERGGSGKKTKLPGLDMYEMRIGDDMIPELGRHAVLKGGRYLTGSRTRTNSTLILLPQFGNPLIVRPWLNVSSDN